MVCDLQKGKKRTEEKEEAVLIARCKKGVDGKGRCLCSSTNDSRWNEAVSLSFGRKGRVSRDAT